MTAPKFTAGQRVRIIDRTPPVHHRVPSYAKGQVGVIERVCGVHGEPEKFIRGDGETCTASLSRAHTTNGIVERI